MAQDCPIGCKGKLLGGFSERHCFQIRDRHSSRVHRGRLAFQSFLLALNMNVMPRDLQSLLDHEATGFWTKGKWLINGTVDLVGRGRRGGRRKGGERERTQEHLGPASHDCAWKPTLALPALRLLVCEILFKPL